VKLDQLLDRGRASPAGQGLHHRLDKVDVLGLPKAHHQSRHVVFGGESFKSLSEGLRFFRRSAIETGSSHGLDQGFNGGLSARGGDAVGPLALFLGRGSRFEALNQRWQILRFRIHH